MVLKAYPSMKSIPVRKPPVADIWDQYLLYGIQNAKRSYSEISQEKKDKPPTPFSSLCLSREELLANNYCVVQSAEQQRELKKEGYLIIYQDASVLASITESFVSIERCHVET